MKTRLTAVVAAVILGVAAPVSSAMAFTYGAPYERSVRSAPSQGTYRGPIAPHDGPMFDRCAHSSASEGNARQQNFPVKQYGQTSGGPLC